MLSQSAQELMGLLRGGSYSLSRDALKHRVWDTRYFDTTVSDYTFYMQPIGSAWRAGAKTLNETNMYDAGKLPNGQVFLAVRFGVSFISYDAVTNTDATQVAQACYNILDSSVFEIKIQGREWDYQIHGSEFTSRPVHITGAIQTNFPVRVGDMIASGWSQLQPTPIVIDQLVSFQVIHRLNNPDSSVVTVLNASTNLLHGLYSTMQVSLEGLLTRAK